MPRRPSRAPARRRMIWARTLTSTGVGIPIAGAQIDLLDGFRVSNGGAQPIGSTITRVRIDLTMQVPGAFVPNDALVCGLIIDQATGILTEVPQPVTDRHADWMWWRRLSLVNPHSTSDQDATGPLATSYEIDVRAQRKMEELGETLWFSAQAAGGSAVDRILLTTAFSVLLKLP